MAAARLEQLQKTSADADLNNAGFLILFAFTLFTAAILLGTLGLLSAWGAAGLSALYLIFFIHRDRKILSLRLKTIHRELNLAIQSCPLLLFVVSLFSLLRITTPMHGGDSLIYHLPNVNGMIETASTLQISPGCVYNPDAVTTYFPKGMEAIYALFYLFPLPDVTIAIFKLTVLLSFYFILKSATRSRKIAAGVFAFVISTEVIWFDLSSLKNDLVVGLAVTYSALVLLQRKRTQALPIFSLSAALALAVATKSNALFYCAVLLSFWFIREYRKPARLIVPLCIITFLGGYFYLVNIAQTGSPVYPYGVHISGITLFEGIPNNLWPTTILANFGRETPGIIVRGLIRQMSPLGTGALLVSGVFLLTVLLRRKTRMLYSAISVKELLLIFLFLLGWMITPYTDRNTSTPHNLLYSGNTIRIALPCLLLFILAATRNLAVWSKAHSTWLPPAGWILCVAIPVNVFWYDGVALFIKPENAFYAVAPLAKTFDNQTLALWLAGITLICIALTCVRKCIVLPFVLIASAVIFPIHHPDHLTYTTRFKQLNQTTSAFAVLDKLDMEHSKVALLASGKGSYFVGCANEIVMKKAKQVRYINDPKLLNQFDLVIACAHDTATALSNSKGTQFNILPPPLEPSLVPAAFTLLHADSFYRIYYKPIPH